MNSLRFLVVGVLFTLPFFAFAQTATSTAEQPLATTTAEQPPQADKILQAQIDQLVQSRMNLLPKLEDVRKNAISDLLDVKISPSNPGPNVTVRVTVESYLSNMNKAVISWSLNNRVVLGGVGKTSFSFQNGPSGKTTTLSISIVTNTGESITKEFSWTPVGVTLFWEADTYTPPFYRGKALLSPQARVKVIATPDNTGTQNALDAGKLVYVWEKDGSAIPESSGYGRNSFIFTGPKPYNEANVKVRVSSVDDTVKSEARVHLPLSSPFIVFYEKHPLLGVLYNQRFNTTLNPAKKEFSISAEPYFFSNERGETQTIQYSWSVNGKPVQNHSKDITLKNEAGAKGISAVSLAMRGTTQSFQRASQSIVVNFANSPSSTRPTF